MLRSPLPRRLSVLAALIAALVALVGPRAAHAQGFIIDVPGGREIHIAVPAPVTPSGDPQGVAKEIHQTLLRDIELSGYFSLIDPKAYVDPGRGVEPGSFKFDDWTLINATVLVKTRVLPAGDASCDPSGQRACADAFIYYVVNGEKLVSKRFRAEGTHARHLAHRIANLVVQSVTGRPGFFGAQLTAIGSQSGTKEVYVLDLDGSQVRPVSRNGSINLSPSFSPDGRSLAWTSYKKANPDIHVKDLPTGRTRVVSNIRGVNTSPAFSPDGKTIAVARTSSGGDTDIFLLDARTGAQIDQLTRGGGIDVSPDFSPDGRHVVFSSERSGGSQIYTVDLQTKELKRVTFNGDFNTDPVFSPDGTRIAFIGRNEGGFDVYVCGLDGKDLQRLTQDMGDNEDPSWSPDGMYLVFSSTRSGRSELWMSTADGRHQVQLTRTGGWTQPSFAPTGPR